MYSIHAALSVTIEINNLFYKETFISPTWCDMYDSAGMEASNPLVLRLDFGSHLPVIVGHGLQNLVAKHDHAERGFAYNVFKMIKIMVKLSKPTN
jgi:hypothetical protein